MHMSGRSHDHEHSGGPSLNHLAFSATAHCLTGCAIGERPDAFWQGCPYPRARTLKRTATIRGLVPEPYEMLPRRLATTANADVATRSGTRR